MRRWGLGVAASAVALLAFTPQISGAQSSNPQSAVASLGIAEPKSWTNPVPPYRIADRLYYVGSEDLTAYLFDTGDGLILLDVGLPQNADRVLANIKALGFDPKTVRILLSSHAHFDHAGGMATVKAATGAKLYAMPGDAPILEAGGKGDPDVGDKVGFSPVKVDRLLRDGETVSLGKVKLTAHLTPGHTPGCTTWTMPITVDGQARTATFICSLTILPSAPIDWARKAQWQVTYTKFDTLPCDLFFASHQSMYDGKRKKAALTPGEPNPFIDPAGCKAFIASHKAEFETKFAKVGG